jgi:cell division septum initiation protein DivIVA
MSTFRVVDRLETVIREGIWLPFGWRAVPADRVLDLIEKLRSSLPAEGASATRGAEAARLRSPREGEPVADPARMTSAEEILARAQARADEIIAQAQNAARDIRRGADEYADHVLASLDASLAKAQAAIQKGRQTLALSTASGNGKPAQEGSAL